MEGQAQKEAGSQGQAQGQGTSLATVWHKNLLGEWEGQMGSFGVTAVVFSGVELEEWMMSNYTLEEWRELRQAGRVVVGGVEFYLHVDGVRSEGDVKIPGTKYALPGGTDQARDVYAAAGYATYDWAKPQDWFEQYVVKHGNAPVGVWWYPPRDHPTDGKWWLSGRFVSFDEAVKKLGEKIVEVQGSAAK